MEKNAILSHPTLIDLQAALQRGDTTCRAVVTAYLENIEAAQTLNAFLEVYAQEALAQAEAVDAKIKAGKAGKLAGLVVGIKDVLCYQDHQVSAASKILEGFVAQFTGTVVQRLIEEDAIIIGRQNCDEFAMGSGNENSAFGVVRNADDTSRVPGGSSGGSAVAVQADLCRISLGTDTGGSVRQPAAFCGLVGLKPTYSRLSRYGLIACASSFDTIGIFAKNAQDAALVMEVVAGKDPYDSTSSSRPVPAYAEKLTLEAHFTQKPKIAYLRQTLEGEGLAPAVRKAMQVQIERLKAQGFEVEVIDFPLLKYSLPIYYLLMTAEASTNLSRYDGVRYGYRSPEVEDLEGLYKNSRSEAFGREVKRRILLGTFVLSADYYDAYFTKAQKVRRLIQEEMKKFFKTYDFILSPTAPTTAFEIGKYEGETVEIYLADLFTVPASVAGIPAISVPVGKDEKGLAIGLQIMGDFFSEEKLLAMAHYLESQSK